jgi:hypothetical protein
MARLIKVAKNPTIKVALAGIDGQKLLLNANTTVPHRTETAKTVENASFIVDRRICALHLAKDIEYRIQ